MVVLKEEELQAKDDHWGGPTPFHCTGTEGERGKTRRQWKL